VRPKYDGTRSPHVFHHERTRRHHRAGAPIRSFRRAFQNAQKAAGISTEFHPHDLRHRRVTTWLAEGRDVVHAKEAVGHADLRTTMGYTHLAREHLKSLVSARTPRDDQ
jgi:site-specific recombinase XerD